MPYRREHARDLIESAEDGWARERYGALAIADASSDKLLGAIGLRPGVLSRVGGWFAIVIGIVIVGGYAIFGDMPPFVAYLPTGLLGILLLPKRSRSYAEVGSAPTAPS